MVGGGWGGSATKQHQITNYSNFYVKQSVFLLPSKASEAAHKCLSSDQDIFYHPLTSTHTTQKPGTLQELWHDQNIKTGIKEYQITWTLDTRNHPSHLLKRRKCQIFGICAQTNRIHCKITDSAATVIILLQRQNSSIFKGHFCVLLMQFIESRILFNSHFAKLRKF